MDTFEDEKPKKRKRKREEIIESIPPRAKYVLAVAVIVLLVLFRLPFGWARITGIVTVFLFMLGILIFTMRRT